MSVRGPKWGMTRAPWAGVSPPPHAPRAFGVPGGSFWAAGAPRVRPWGAMGRCNMHLLRTIATCVRGPRAGHNPSTARGRFAAPPPPPRPQCTRGVPLGRRGALGAAMRGHGHVYLILLSYCCGDRRPLQAEPRHHHGRAWGASPVAGGRELRSPGATDVNFRSQDARNADVLSHRDTALILQSQPTFRC